MTMVVYIALVLVVAYERHLSRSNREVPTKSTSLKSDWSPLTYRYSRNLTVTRILPNVVSSKILAGKSKPC
jgi:hypothetical protein